MPKTWPVYTLSHQASSPSQSAQPLHFGSANLSLRAKGPPAGTPASQWPCAGRSHGA